MNYLLRVLIAGFINVSICFTTWAATVIERTEMGNTQKFTITEHHARIQGSDSNSYTQMDLQKRKVYMVNTKEKRMVEMDIIGQLPKPPQGMPSGRDSQQPYRQAPPWNYSQRGRQPPPRSQTIKAELVKQGDGPTIAGYPTVSYQLKADGKVCLETYLSKKALEVAYLKDFAKAMLQMSNSRKSEGMQMPPCLKAYKEKEAESMKIGVPLRTVMKSSKRGDKVMNEVISIKTDVKIPADTFALPTSGYKLMTEQEMIEEGQAKMREQMEKARQQRGYPPQNWRNEGRQYPHMPPR